MTALTDRLAPYVRQSCPVPWETSGEEAGRLIARVLSGKPAIHGWEGELAEAVVRAREAGAGSAEIERALWELIG